MPVGDTAKLVASLELQDKFSATAQRFDKTIGGIERQTSTLGRVGNEVGRGLQTAGRNLVFLGAAGGTLLATQVKFGIDSLVELADATAQTEARLESTGGAANVTAEAVRDLSVALEEQTTIDDKAIQRGQNMLLTFTNIRNEVGKGNDVFNQATVAVLDLATAMGTEPEQAAIQLGKALNDPIRGLTALRRVGIQFTEDQEEQIETLVESGRVMEAQKIILAELTREFGGSARAFGEGPGAAQRRFADAVEDGQQALAKGLLPVIERFSRMAQEAFSDPKVIAGIESFGRGLGEGIEQLIDIASGLPWGAIGSSLQIAGTGAKAVLDAFTSLPDWVQTAVLTGWGLNKLTGGALGNIGGILGKAAFGQLRGTTPANPVFTKEVGLGGVGGGARGAPPAGGLPPAAGAPALAGPLALGGGILLPFAMFNLIPELFRKEGGGQSVSRTNDQGDMIVKLDPQTTAMFQGMMPSFISTVQATGGQVTGAVNKVYGGVTDVDLGIDQTRGDIRDLHNPLEALHRIQERRRAEAATADAARIAGLNRLIERTDRTKDEIRTTASRTAAQLSKIESVERVTAANTNRTEQTLARKNFSPDISTNVTVNSQVSVSDVVRHSITQHVASGYRGGLIEGL